MVHFCAAENCNNTSSLNNISFHRFPFSRPDILEEWIKAINRKDFIPTKHSRLCSAHFDVDSYYLRLDSANPRLKEDAVPKIFNYPSYPQKPPAKKRRVLVRQLQNLLSFNEMMSKYTKGHSCSVVACQNTFTNAKKRGLPIRFHSFPKDEATRKAWTANCCRKDKINPDLARVCSEHFSEEDYEDTIKARVLGRTPEILRKTAIPTLLLSTSKPETNQPPSKLLEVKEQKKIINKLLCEEWQIDVNPDPKEISQKGNKRTFDDLETDPKTPALSQKKVKSVSLKNQLMTCEEEISSLKAQLIICKESTKEQIRTLERSNTELRNTIDMLVTGSEAQFESKVKELFKDFLTENQIDILLDKKSRAAVWTDDVYVQAINLRSISKKAYRYVREHMNYPIPGLRALKRWEDEQMKNRMDMSMDNVNVELCKKEECVCGLCPPKTDENVVVPVEFDNS